MKAALQAAGDGLLYTVKRFLAHTISFPISEDKTGADLADGCDKIKPPPRGMNAGAHADGSLGLFTSKNEPGFGSAVH